MSVCECVCHNKNDTHSLSLNFIAPITGSGVGLDKSLSLVTAIDFDVDLGIIFFLFSLFVKVFPKTQQVEGQQEPKHAEDKETHIHLGRSGEKEEEVQQILHHHFYYTLYDIQLIGVEIRDLTTTNTADSYSYFVKQCNSF